jgi:hypothetical protein
MGVFYLRKMEASFGGTFGLGQTGRAAMVRSRLHASVKIGASACSSAGLAMFLGSAFARRRLIPRMGAERSFLRMAALRMVETF